MQQLEKRPIRLIALDLDDTTLSSHSELPERNRAILEAAARQGIEVVPASGRSFVSMQGVLELFPWSHYAICSNGAVVCALPDGEVLHQKFLPEETIRELQRICGGEFLSYEVYVDGQAYAQQDYIEHCGEYMCDEDTEYYVKSTRKPVPDILEFIDRHIHEIQSFVICYGNEAVKARILAALYAPGEDERLQHAYVTSSVDRLAEIANRDCGKHRGLEFLTGYLGIPQEQVIAFGNADNDAEMLSWAGTGVAVANASDNCKACADIITGDYRDCGVAQVLEQLIDPDASV